MKLLNPKNKIIVTAVLLCFVVILVMHWINSVELDSQVIENLALEKDKEKPKDNLVLSPREEAIKNYFSENNSINVNYGGQGFSLVVYRDSEGVRDKENNIKIHNHTDFPYDRPGIILFNQENIFWESNESFNIIFPWTVNLIDFDNDTVDEIFVVDLNGEKLTGCSIYMYKWVDNGIKLITPYKEVKGTDPRDETKNYEGKVTILSQCEPSLAPNGLIDLDNDKILEIMVREYLPDNVIRAYKWNGDTYEVWRELIVPPEVSLGEYKGTVDDFMKDSKML